MSLMYTRNEEYYSEENLTCPITRQLFRDPVLANDGHIYERTAIVHWISQQGTSPLTGEPLSIDNLRTEENIKRLCERQRTPVTYSAGNERVTLPPLRVPRIPPIIGQPPMMVVAQQSTRDKKCMCYKFGICIAIVVLIIVLAISIPLIVASHSSGTICLLNRFYFLYFNWLYTSSIFNRSNGASRIGYSESALNHVLLLN